MATTYKKHVLDIIERFSVMECFDFFITKEHVARVKQDIECFLKTMGRVRAVQKDDILFENSEKWLIAARASGADYLRIYGYN